ncbi:MAG: NAD(P)-dependent oxidoreductase [Actinomycetia bacterium]|nr:NAD(P)-dependent oxidoreductase [Actinomycetes bacterium]
MATTAFIGLGVMGFPMAGHLLAAGHDTVVWNRTTVKAEVWVDEHDTGSSGSTPSETAAGRDIVFLCVGNDDDVRSVAYGDDGVLAGMSAGSILVDHTTTSAALARELGGACADAGVGFIDAPISGGQAGAENGVLTVMCGGSQEHFDIVAPVIDAYSKRCNLIGPTGSGQLTKMVNQICIAGLVQALSEGVEFAKRAGLDTDKVFDTISAGAAGSWQMDNRHETMAADHFEHGFAVDWMRKDLGYCIEEGGHLGLDLEVTRLVDGFYSEIQDMGGGRWDTSSLLRRITD